MSNANKKVVNMPQEALAEEPVRQLTPVEMTVNAMYDLLKEVNASEKPLTDKQLDAKVQAIRDEQFAIEKGCVENLISNYDRHIDFLQREKDLLNVQLKVMTEKVMGM